MIVQAFVEMDTSINSSDSASFIDSESMQASQSQDDHRLDTAENGDGTNPKSQVGKSDASNRTFCYTFSVRRVRSDDTGG